MPRLSAAVVAAALSLAACTGGGSPEPTAAPTAAGENAVTVEAVDRAFRVGGTVDAGLTRITFANSGTQPHVMALHRLKRAMPPETLQRVLTSRDPSDDADEIVEPGVLVDGSQGLLGPGKRLTTYARLEAGVYGLVCYALDSATRRQHYADGMVEVLTVNDTPATMPEPAVAGEIRVDDATLHVPDLSRGKGTYKFTNTGGDRHALMLMRLADGKGYADLLAYTERVRQGKATDKDFPGEYAGTVNALRGTTWVELDLRPGRYLALDTAPRGTGGFYYLDENGGLRAEFEVA